MGEAETFSESEITQNMRDINHIIEKRMRKAFEGSGLTPPQVMVLGFVIKHDVCRVSDISAYLKLAASTVSSILDRLERNGYVKRERYQEDKRIVQIRLTEQAIKLKSTLKETISVFMNEMTEQATQTELEQISQGLRLMKAVLERDGEVRS